MKNPWLAVVFAIGCALFAFFIIAARTIPDELARGTFVDLSLVGFALVIVILATISIFGKDKEKTLALLFVGLLASASSAISFIGVVVIVPAAILLIGLAISRIFSHSIKHKM